MMAEYRHGRDQHLIVVLLVASLIAVATLGWLGAVPVGIAVVLIVCQMFYSGILAAEYVAAISDRRRDPEEVSDA